MANPILYYTNASEDGLWETLTNWNTAQDGSGDTPTEIPWTNTDGSTSASDLYGNAATINIGTVIDSGVTGTCYINQPNIYGDIYGGTWVCYGLYVLGNIYGGTFNGDSIVVEGGYIGGGNFSVETYVYVESGGTIDYQWLTFYGSTYGYEWYFTNANGDEIWENLENWSIYPNNYDGGFGLYRPTEAPWSGQDGSTNASNLYATPNNNQNLYKSSDTSAEVTGTCHIDWVYNSGNVHGGTWAGTFSNGGNIYAGTLVTGWFFNEGGTVYEGTFTHYGNQNYSDIYGGTFTGANFINIAGYYYSGSIHGGIFTGINFHNYDGSVNGIITGGTFEITGFNNGNGSIDFANISITQNGLPYTGTWLGQTWSNGSYVPPYYSTIYYTNASEDGLWETPANWNTASDGTGDIATGAPWSGTNGNLYGDSDLQYGDGINNSVTINSTIGGTSSTGSCDIEFNNSGIINGGLFTAGNCRNDGDIYGGTFSGDSFDNYNYIGDGTFSGDYFSNNGGATIYGGTFSGDSFDNYSYIGDGTFSGDYFDNYSYIDDGTFSGDYFSNNGGANIYGGTFSGDSFYNNNNSFILGGTFTGYNFDNEGTITTGTFSGSGFYQVNGTIVGGTFNDIVDNSGIIYGGTFLAGVNNNGGTISFCNGTPCGLDSSNNCLYTDCLGNCNGTAYSGCTDSNACNYDAGASCDDGSCSFPDYCHDCSGNCTCYDCGAGCDSYYDDCGNCNISGQGCYSGCDNCGNCGNYHGGCTDSNACNYDSCANYYDGSCLYSDNCGNCGNYHGGCTDSNACNYDSCANYDDGSCYDYSDYCHDSCGNCTCSDCGAGCDSYYDDCGNCNISGQGCYSGCDNCGNCGNYHGGCIQIDPCANFDDGSCSQVLSTGGLYGNAANILNGSLAWLQLPAGICGVGTNPKSFSFWFNLAQTGIGYQWILMQGNQTDGQEWICFTETDSTLYFLYAEDGNYNSWSGSIQSGIIPTSNEWHHIVITFTGNTGLGGTATLYYDGDIAGNVNYNNIQDLGSSYLIGNYFANGNGNFVETKFDEFGIFNRCLDQFEVTELYNSGSGKTYPNL